MNYAEIDKDGYAVGIYTLNDEVSYDNYVYIGDQDIELGQKYDRINKVWLDEFKPLSPILPQITLGGINKTVIETKQVVVNTEGAVMMTSEDALTIMEYQTVLDEKLSKLITHLGL